VPMGVSPNDALQHVALIMLANDVSLRGLAQAEIAKGFGFLHAKPSSAFSPVAVSPAELGSAWSGGRLHLTLNIDVKDKPLGRVEAARDMLFDFGQLIAHAAKTRMLSAGTIIGSGTISNRGDDGGSGLPVAEGGRGYACIAEQRAVEMTRAGKATTPFLAEGDTVRLEMRDAAHHSIFGAIEQTVKAVALSDT
jgi:fumarylacetoacetate (FAA) hydrolase